MKVLALAMALPLAGSCSANAQAFDPHDPRSPLFLMRTIELADVRGRIDHLAIDDEHNRLFVAEYGNGTVDDIDLSAGRVMGRITGLREPQGVGWLARENEIAVASGDGRLTFYRASDRQQVAALTLGDDADDVRIDGRNGNLVVGFGSGALAVIDPATHRVVRELRLPAHPEGFELVGGKAFVNVPDAHKIVVADLDQARILKTLATGTHFGNFPMASDGSGARIAVAFRLPGSVAVMDARSTQKPFSVSTCGDADDLYFRSNRLVVICGSGAVELIDPAGGHSNIRVTTQRGARTGLLTRSGDRLFVAVPAGEGAAAIWELSFR